MIAWNVLHIRTVMKHSHHRASAVFCTKDDFVQFEKIEFCLILAAFSPLCILLLDLGVHIFVFNPFLGQTPIEHKGLKIS